MKKSFFLSALILAAHTSILAAPVEHKPVEHKKEKKDLSDIIIEKIKATLKKTDPKIFVIASLLIVIAIQAIILKKRNNNVPKAHPAEAKYLKLKQATIISIEDLKDTLQKVAKGDLELRPGMVDVLIEGAFTPTRLGIGKRTDNTYYVI